MASTNKTATVMTCVRNGYTTTPPGYAVGGPGPSPSYNNSIYMTFPDFGLAAGSYITSATMHYDMTSWDWQAAVVISLKCAVGEGEPTNQVATQGSADTTNVPAATLTDTYNATNTAREMLATGDLYLKMYAPNGDNRKNYSSTEAILTINYITPPAAPTIGTAARVTDSIANVAWTNNNTTDAPYTTLYVERQTDGGSWVQVAALTGSATNLTDATISANHAYAYRVKAENSAGSATSSASSTIYTTPSAPTIGTASKTGASEVTLTWDDTSNSEQYFEVSRTNDGGDNWTVIEDEVAAGLEIYVDSSLPSGTVSYRVRAYRGSLYSAYSSESNEVTTTAPPAAPTLTSGWGTYSPTGSTLRVTWQHNSLDGSPQSAADIYYTIDGTPTTYNLSGATAYYDIPISGGVATDVVTAKVRTYGLHVDPGVYSSIDSTTLADEPQANITTPAADDAVVTDLPLVVAWSYTDEFSQASWTLQLHKSGTLVGSWSGTTETSQSVGAAYLDDDSEYSLTLVVRSGSGFDDEAVRTFETDYVPPTVPVVSAAFDTDTLAVSVFAYAGETGALPATDHLVLLRMDAYDGVTDTETLIDPLVEGSTFIDYLPRLGQTVTYRVLAVAANGAYSYTDAEVSTAMLGYYAVNFGDGDATVLALQWNATSSNDSSDDSEVFTFAGREKPVLYAGEHTTETISVAGVIGTDAERTTLRSLRQWRRLCTYRDPRGRREHVKVTVSDSDGGTHPITTNVSLALLVVE